jgi:hypothetical protein
MQTRLTVLELANGWLLSESRLDAEGKHIDDLYPMPEGFCYGEEWTKEGQRKAETEALRRLLIEISNRLLGYDGFSEYNICITVEKGDEV